MTDPIEPALTPEQWKPDMYYRGWEDYELPPTIPGAIAWLNASLPDTDPRKITREMLRDLRETAHLIRDDMARVYGPEAQWGNVPHTLARMADRAIAHADALASYLPPEQG